MATYLTTILVLAAGVLNPQQSRVAVVFFTQSGCGPCLQMKAPLAQLQTMGVPVHTVDCSQRGDLVSRFKVQNLPTIVILGDGQEFDRLVGATDYDELKKRVDRVSARFGVSSGASFGKQSASLVQAEQPAVAAGPIVRGQSPGLSRSGAAMAQLAAESAKALGTRGPESQETGGVVSPQEAIQRASTATVRIRVDEGNSTAHGTGTIVDVHGKEALVLTCGHLFRDMQPGSVVSVDLFAGTPREINLPSQLVDFKAEEEDIGLIVFELPVPVEPVPLIPKGERPQIGQTVFSFGCDHGANPSRRDTRITNVDRYVGAANIEISGAPAVGRSGGGLFDMQGRLIGVCNAADANDDEGIYAGAQVIYDQINRLGLGHLFDRQPSENPALQLAGPGSIQASHEDSLPSMPTLSQPDSALAIAPSSTLASSDMNANPQTAKLIVIVREPSGKDRILEIDEPSAALLREIEAEHLR